MIDGPEHRQINIDGNNYNVPININRIDNGSTAGWQVRLTGEAHGNQTKLFSDKKNGGTELALNCAIIHLSELYKQFDDECYPQYRFRAMVSDEPHFIVRGHSQNKSLIQLECGMNFSFNGHRLKYSIYCGTKNTASTERVAQAYIEIVSAKRAFIADMLQGGDPERWTRQFINQNRAKFVVLFGMNIVAMKPATKGIQKLRSTTRTSLESITQSFDVDDDTERFLRQFRRAKCENTLEIMANAAERNHPKLSGPICKAFALREQELGI